MKAFANPEDGSNLKKDVSPILTYINALNESVVFKEEHSKLFKSLSLKQLRQETDVDEDGFGFAVSLRDGTCLYTSKGMSKHLGFPKNMLDGQTFTSFLNQRDHFTFANHLSQVLNVCFVQGQRNDHLASNTFFCRMRRYHSLKDGYVISDRTTAYKPFRIQLHLNELLVDDMCIDDLAGTLCVNATATVITSGYSAPEEIPAMSAFTTRHTSSCHFSHVDGSAIPYIGYLPQDLIGFSIFDFYHIDDMPQLKEIYELVAKEGGSAFRSKPYRFKIQNGCYISLETEWSCFINPFTHKLEFVIGQHRVLKGPTDLDIFNAPKKQHEVYFPEEIVKESRKIQDEIIIILTSRTYLTGFKPKRVVSKRKRDLLNFVYNSFNKDDDETNETKQKCKGVAKDDSATEDDTVVMGDVSPYHEVAVSSVSSDTPPTVQNFRLQENLERFFASKPKTYSEGSDDLMKNQKVSGDGTHSQSSSGCGSGSGNSGDGSANNSVETSASKCDQNSPGESSNNSNNSSNNNEQQGSNSSKCNFSNFSDSGYGKCFSNNGKNDGQGIENQMGFKSTEDCNGNKAMEWQDGHRTEGEETFYSCLALPEHSLSKRNSHKHFKKELQATSTDNWLQQQDFQQKDFPEQEYCHCNKPPHPLQSTLVQTDCVWNGNANPCTFHQHQHSCGPAPNACGPAPNACGPAPNACGPAPNSCGPAPNSCAPVPNSCVPVPNSCAPVPTQFYVPLMYMPQQNQNSQPQYSFGAPTANPQAQYTCGTHTTNPQAQCSFGAPTTNPQIQGSFGCSTTNSQTQWSSGPQPTNPQAQCSFGAPTNSQAQWSFGAPTTNPQAQGSFGCSSTNSQTQWSSGPQPTNPQAQCSFGVPTNPQAQCSFGAPTNPQAQWSCGPQTTNTSNPIQSGETSGYKSYQNFENSGNFHRPAEEFRAPPTPCKTTMEPSRDFSGSYQNQREENYGDQNTYYGKMMENFTEAVDSQMQKRSVEQVEEMQGEESPSSSFLSRSSSYDKDEDMDNDKENPSVRPTSSKVDLSSESAYRYCINVPNMEDTLQKDREVLKSMAQPEMVNRQLLQLQEEREQENQCKINLGEDKCNITEAIMLGLAMDDCNDELEKREEYLLQLMSED